MTRAFGLVSPASPATPFSPTPTSRWPSSLLTMRRRAPTRALCCTASPGATDSTVPRTTRPRSHRGEWGLSASQMVEGRCVMGVWCRPSRRPIFTVSVNLPFILLTSRLLSTHVGCLLTSGFLGQTPSCVATMFVCITQTSSSYRKTSCRRSFVGIATNDPVAVRVWRVFDFVCLPHMIRSSRRIVEDDRRRSRRGALATQASVSAAGCFRRARRCVGPNLYS